MVEALEQLRDRVRVRVMGELIEGSGSGLGLGFGLALT